MVRRHIRAPQYINVWSDPAEEIQAALRLCDEARVERAHGRDVLFQVNSRLAAMRGHLRKQPGCQRARRATTRRRSGGWLRWTSSARPGSSGRALSSSISGRDLMWCPDASVGQLVPVPLTARRGVRTYSQLYIAAYA